MVYLIQGFLLGIAYVAPIGTQNMFVINTALTQKRSRTLLTALIVMFFDITLAVGCYFGIGALMDRSFWFKLIIVGIGSLVVIWIGIGLLRSKGTLEDRDTNIPILKIITTACIVTWFNPQAIIDGSLLLGASKASIPSDLQFYFILGFSLASMVWWIAMSMIVNLLQKKINDKVLRIINIICGIIIVFYGCKLLYSGIKMADAYFMWGLF